MKINSFIKLPITQCSGHTLVNVANIDYIEPLEHGCLIHMQHRQLPLHCKLSLQEVEDKLAQGHPVIS